MTLVLNQKTAFFTLFMMPDHSSSICDKFYFAGASAVTVTRNDHHNSSCLKEILKKILIRNLLSKNSNSGLAMTKLTVTPLLCMIDLLIMIKYTTAKMPIKSCAYKAPSRLATVVIRSDYSGSTSSELFQCVCVIHFI